MTVAFRSLCAERWGFRVYVNWRMTGILVSGTKESASHGINLLNRLEQLKLQKQDLRKKLGLIFTDENVENVICMVDAEIEKVEGELAKLAAKKENQIK